MIQFVVKRVGTIYESALIVDGKFQRSGSDTSVTSLVSRFLSPVLGMSHKDGTEIALDITINVPKEPETANVV